MEFEKKDLYLQLYIAKNSMGRLELIQQIGGIVSGVRPDAQTILYGSEARGEAKKGSDIDVLILIDKDQITPQEEKVITNPIYDLEFETGIIISPLVMTKKAWEAMKKQTLFYYNVMKDGVLI